MSRFKQFAMGLGHLTRGFLFLLSNPRLWVWAILPTLINFAILSLMLTVFIHYYSDIYTWLTAHIGRLNIANAEAWYWQILSGLLWVLNMILQAFIVLISLIVLLIVSYALGLVIASPFNDILSEKVEKIAAGYEPPPFALGKFITDSYRIIKVEVLKAVIFIAIPVILFVLNFIPVVGGALYVALTLIFGAWALGFSYADLPMGRRAQTFGERFLFARKNKWSLIGLGIGFIIPFFALIFVTPIVVGGTLLYIEVNRINGPKT